MDDVAIEKISYTQLKGNYNCVYKDDFGVLSGYLTANVCKTLLTNPNLIDDTQIALNLVVCNGSIVGRNMLMPTCIKVKNAFLRGRTGGSYEIVDECRGKGLGTKIFKESIFNEENSFYLGQLYSKAAAAIIDKLGLTVFHLPLFFKLCNVRSVLEAKGFKGILLRGMTKILNIPLKIFDLVNILKMKELKKRYVIKKESVIPRWVEVLTVYDDHDFAEIHDCKWLQWCLDNRFTNHPRDTQAFFAVYDKKGEPKGFFMTKERFEKKQGIYRNLIRGFVVEWGSFDQSQLSEADLNLMAVSTFGKDVDNITTILSDSCYSKTLKRMGFLRHGNYQMSIKLGQMEYEGIRNPNKWRIRYGGCNTIIL